ncbi:hypothetical protein [Lentilitoribacter sp. EG35]|uniref:hypothetical protein n=1 Tax=Lentilitoribacter sp. EG35 TaxID=3234192 RepID=UPI0034602F96
MPFKNKLLITTACVFISLSAASAQQNISPAEAEKLVVRSEVNLKTNIATVQRLESNPPSSFEPAKTFSAQTPDGKNYIKKLTEARIAAAASEKRLRYGLSQQYVNKNKNGAPDNARFTAEEEYKSERTKIQSELAREIKLGNREQAEKQAKAAFLAAQARRRAKLNAANDADGVEGDDLFTVRQLSQKAVAPLREKQWFDFEDKPASRGSQISQRSQEYAAAANVVEKLERQEAYRTALDKAENGNFPTLHGIERVVIEREIKKGMQDRFKAATPGDNEYDPLSWFKSTSESHPNNFAYREVRQNIASDPELKALDHLSPTQKLKPSSYFAAASKALVDERASVDKWMQKKIAEEYVTTGVSALDQWQAKIRTGLGTAAQLYGLAGDKSMDVLRKNHNEFRALNATAQEAMLAASEVARKKLPISSLSKEHYNLLKNAGFIETGKAGDKFVISTKNKKLGKLYGSRNADTQSNFILDALDTVSGEAAIKIAVSQGASALAATQATGTVTGLIADVAVDTVLDASYELASGKKIDFKRLVRDKAVQQLSSGLVGQAGNKWGEVFASRQAQSSTRKLLTGLMGEGAEGLIEETIIATSEGRDISPEQIAQSLVQNAFQKALSSSPDSYRFIEKQIKDSFGPDQIIARNDVLKALKAVEDRRVRVNEEQRVAIDERFAKALGNDGIKDVVNIANKTDLNAKTNDEFYGSSRFKNPADKARNDALATKLLQATERGELSFSDISAKLADDPNLKPVVEEYAVRREKLIKKAVEPAREAALADIEREAKKRLDDAKAKSPNGNINPEIAAQIKRWQDAEIEKANTPLIAPGSKNPTSDIDRSTASEFLRSRLKEQYRNLGAFGDAPAATSARTLDVNEYINVFNTINDTRASGTSLDKLPATGDYEGFSHAEAVEINSLSAAMRHMGEDQKRLYEQNKLEGLDPLAKERLKKKFEAARQLQKKTDGEIKIMRDQIAAKRKADGLPPLQDSDLSTAARDALYGQRTKELGEKKFEFDEAGRELDIIRRERAQTDPELAALLKQKDDIEAYLSRTGKDGKPDTFDSNKPEARLRLTEINRKLNELATTGSKEAMLIGKRSELAAYQERQWGHTLGGGIETYTSYAGLDAVVSQVQLTGKSIRDLVDGNSWLANKYSKSEISNAIDDQIMMITHHMNEFNEGFEGAPDAAKALGKYAERALLFVQLQGGKLPESFNELSKLTKDMVANRKDAEKLKAVMLKYAKEKTGKADLDVGIKELAKLIENTLPGAKGLFDPLIIKNEKKNNPEAYKERRKLAQTYIRKERERENEAYRLTNGDQALADKLGEELDQKKQRLAGLENERQRHRNFSKYPLDKWGDAEGLLSEQDRLEKLLKLASFPSDDQPCVTPKCIEIRTAIDDVKKQLRDIEVPRDKDGNLILSEEMQDILDKDDELISDAKNKVENLENDLKGLSEEERTQIAGNPLERLQKEDESDQQKKFWSPNTPLEITIGNDEVSARYLDASVQLRVE